MGWIGTKEREISHPLFLSLPIAAALNPINAIAPLRRRRRSGRAVEAVPLSKGGK